MLTTAEKLDNLSYSSLIGGLNTTLATKRTLEKEVGKYRENLFESQQLYVNMLNAQKILATLSDENTLPVLNFVTGMTNKVLAEIFPNDPVSVDIKPKLFGGSKPHVILEIKNESGYILDVSSQCGTGLTQIISFMYVITSIEVVKGRRLLICDERLNGLHKSAKRFMSHIIQLFAKGGFQFIFVEYSLNDLGKIYNAEKKGEYSKLVSFDGKYDDDCIFFESDVDLSVLSEDYVDEEEEE